MEDRPGATILKVLRRVFPLVLAISVCLGQQVITTVAGSEFVFPRTPLQALNAPLPGAFSVAFDRAGNLLFSDGTSRVYRTTPSGVLSIVAGNGFKGFSGDGGAATSASLNEPRGLSMDTAGNLYIADFGNYRVRKVSPAGVITTVAGNGQFGFSGDGGLATAAALKPSGVAVDTAGNLYIADPNNSRIRRVTAGGIVTTLAGNGQSGFSGDGGPASAASLNFPYGIAIDAAQNIYIADTSNYRIRKVSPAGIITTIAGNGDFRISGDGGPATSAAISFATGVTVDSAGNLFIAADDLGGQEGIVRKVSVQGIISKVAGNGQRAFAGDGGPATAAALNGPQGLAVDAAQNLYIGDHLNARIRKVSPLGVIATVAGSGLFGFSGDRGPATAASLSKPDGVAVDSMGNLYIADTGNNVVRRVSPSGLITTIAGNGQYGFSGDGGPATAASLYTPEGVAVDAAGNIYIADSRNNRIRKVSTSGIITTVAGNGECCQTGDGGPATAARISQPYGVAVDAAGNMYISNASAVRKVSPSGIITTIDGVSGFGVATDLAGNLYVAGGFNRKVSKVSPGGVVTTFAGNGQNGSSGDGGLATSGALAVPVGVAVDLLGNVYISDAATNSIRRVSTDGIITTIAGDQRNRFAGDGGPATNASLNHPDGVAVDSSGNVFIADTNNNRIREVPASAPPLLCSPQSLSFAGSAGGAPAPAQVLFVSTSVPYLAFSVSVTTSDGANWLAADLSSGVTPRSIQVTSDPSVLMDAGVYTGQIVISSALASGSPISIPVSFTVGPGLPPALAVDQPNLTFTFPAKASARSQAVRVRNSGGGSLNFNVSVDPAAPWLSVSPTSGTATPATPVSLTVTADPTGLPAGTYSGSLTVTADAAITIPVIMNISTNASALLLSQAGLSFTAVAQGGIVPPQNFGISNLGTEPLNPSVKATTISGADWLLPSLVTGAAGMQSVDVRVDPSQLAQGRYYGVVSVQSPGAANSPQVATAMLEVLPAGTNVGAALLPNELTFNAVAGGGSPSSQIVSIFNLTATTKAFLASASDAFVAIAPQTSVVAPGQPGQLIVQPFTDSLPPGTYRSSITLQFDDGAVRVARLTVVISAPGGAVGSRGARAAHPAQCQPSQLLPSIKSLGSGFAVPTGWPVAIQTQVQDDCGAPLESGSVIAEFSNGDPALSLLPLPGGRWDATWQTHGNPATVTVTVRAISGDKQLTGSKQVAGAFSTNQTPPMISNVTNSAANQPFQALTPGGLVTVSGSLLADQTAQASSVPLGTTLGTTTVLIAGRPMPIALIDPSNVSGIIPYGIEVNTQQQILLQREDTLSLPVRVNLASASPAIFTTDGGRGMIVDANGKAVDPGNPARSGDRITIYCIGLGEINETVTAGDFGPSASTARTPVAVTIGGQNSTVNYSGLAPQLVGIYFVQATVPDGLPAGDQVPVTLTSLTTPSATSAPVITSITN